MRINEIVESVTRPIDQVIDEIVTSFVAMGKTDISTAKLAAQLTRRSGVSVTPDTLVPLLHNHPMVKSVDVNKITVGNVTNDEYGKPADGNDLDRVSQMADGAVDLGD